MVCMQIHVCGLKLTFTRRPFYDVVCMLLVGQCARSANQESVLSTNYVTGCLCAYEKKRQRFSCCNDSHAGFPFSIASVMFDTRFSKNEIICYVVGVLPRALQAN